MRIELVAAVAALPVQMATALASPAVAAAPLDGVSKDYRAVSLGDLGGGVSLAAAVNDRGQVVGQSFTGQFMHPFRWERGHMTDLGVLSHSTFREGGQANDINNRGQIVGSSTATDN
jgi:probable HAF family extracellular repeat protein